MAESNRPETVVCAVLRHGREEPDKLSVALKRSQMTYGDLRRQVLAAARSLRDTYGMEFADTMDLDIGLKYDAINQGKIDVMNIFTTDGQLSASDIVVLEDDKGLYPSYMCGFVIRQEVLEQHPELQAVFDMVTNILSDEEMAEINYQVETEGSAPEEAASVFLRAKGLLHE